MKYYINCSFDEKEEVKSLGAKWDNDAKKWYFLDKDDVAKFRKWLPPYLSGVTCEGVVFDFGDEAKPFYDEVLRYVTSIYEDEHMENQELEEAEEIDEDERRYAGPFDPEKYKQEINGTAYMIMLKAADLPLTPTVVFKDAFKSPEDVSSEEIKKSIEEKYGYKIKNIGTLKSATVEEMLMQTTFDSTRKLCEKDMAERIINLMRTTGYSFRNCSMILSSCPDATFARGFRWWQSNFKKPQNAKSSGIWCPEFIVINNEDDFNKYVKNNRSVYYADEEKANIHDDLERDGHVKVLINFSVGRVYDIKEVLGITFSEAKEANIFLDYPTDLKSSNPRDGKRKAALLKEIEAIKENGLEAEVVKGLSELVFVPNEYKENDISSEIYDKVILTCSKKSEDIERDIDSDIEKIKASPDEKAVIRAVYSYAKAIFTNDPSSVLGVKSSEKSDFPVIQLEALFTVNTVCSMIKMPDISSIVQKKLTEVIGRDSVLRTSIENNDMGYFMTHAFKYLSRIELFENSCEKGQTLARQILKGILPEKEKQKQHTKGNYSNTYGL